MPTAASTTVSNSPPHRLVLTSGTGVPPIPVSSRKVMGIDAIQAMTRPRRSTGHRSPTKRPAHTRAALSAKPITTSGPTGETSISTASIACSADRAMARLRDVLPKTPADTPVRPDRSSSASQMRQAWSAGYWPTRNSRMFRVTTSQRAWVSAHSPTVMASTSSRPAIRPVSAELSRLENRFRCSHSRGLMAMLGGGSGCAVIGP